MFRYLTPNCVVSSQDQNPRNGTPIDWGRWAITSDDPEFKGKGAKDTGEDYGPAPGTALFSLSTACKLQCLLHHTSTAQRSWLGCQGQA